MRDLVWAVSGLTPGRFDLLQAGTKYGLAAKELTDTTLLTIFDAHEILVHVERAFGVA